MKKQLIRWGIVLCMLLALLPAGASAATGTAKALFTWKASASRATNMAAITDNLITCDDTANTQVNTHNASAVTVNTAEGQKTYNAYYLGTNWRKADNGSYYGLPSEVTAGGEVKATEGLDLCFTNGVGAATSGKEAVNVSFVYSVRTHTVERAETNVYALDKLKVQAATNGTQWLDGSVGIRSWELIGRQVEEGDLTAYLFRIETEDLLTIDGLESGDTISNLRILPHGDYYYAWPGTFFGICELTVNGYTTADDFKAAVPDGRSDLIYIGEQKMRDIVVARARAIAGVEWKTDSDITAYNENCFYGAGVLYRGPMYVRQISKSGYEIWREYIQNGKYTGGTTSDTAVGMDCMSFAYDAYSAVTNSYSWILWQTQSDNALQLLGDLQTDESPTFTETDIFPYNSEEAIYKAYAQMKKGDVMVESTDEGSLHVLIATGNAVVNYKADGVTIDPAASYVPIIEESSTPQYYFKNSSGGTVVVNATSITGTSSKEVSLQMLNSYASQKGYTFLYGSSPRETTYSFTTLRNIYYAPFTLAEYRTGAVEAVDLQTLVLPTNGVDMTGGFTAVAAVDQHADRMRVTLEKLDGTVLCEDSLITNGTANGKSRQYNYCWSYTSSTTMNKALGGLKTGEYRIGVHMLAGPVTEVGADRGEVSEYYRFSIGHEHTCSHGHEVTGEWTNLNTMGSGTLTAGNYYLSGDYAPMWALVTTKDTADPKTGVINICLNGYTLSGENMTTNYMIYTNAGSFTVNICDCAGGGRLAHLSSSTTAENSSAAVIARDKNTVNLYAGTITGNKAGCAVSAISTFNMYGGAIIGNNVRDAVYLHSDASVFNLYGGTVAGNTCTANGVVHGKTTGGTFRMTGGVISENTVPGAIVTGVTRTGEGGVITDGHVCSDHAAMGWKSLNDLYTQGSESMGLTAGSYYLAEDYIGTAALVTPDNTSGVINICLNGHTFSGVNIARDYILRTGSGTCTINIHDCAGGGRITGLDSAGTAETGSAVIIARDGNTVNLYGGTITGNTAACTVSAISTFHMYGGTVAGNTGREVVCLNSDTSVFTMTGGTVAGNTATVNGVIHGKTTGGTFSMTGGLVSDNTVPEGKTVVTGVTRTGEGGTVTDSHACSDHAAMGWTSLNDALSTFSGSTKNYTMPAGKYYLESDLTLDKYLYLTGDVTLCLNGHTLTGMAGDSYIISFTGAWTLDIYDCSEDSKGVIGSRDSIWQGAAGETNSAIIIRAGATVNLYGGTISGVEAGHVIYIPANGTLNMYGGEITGNKSVFVKDGCGGVIHNLGTVNLYGGSIADNEVPTGVTDVITGSGTVNNVGGTTEDPAPSAPTTPNDHVHGVNWTPLSQKISATGRTFLTGGHYYLDDDFILGSGAGTTGEYYIEFTTADSVLCLNGHKLDGQHCKNYIFRASGVNVDICDCSAGQTGTITGLNVDTANSTYSVGIARPNSGVNGHINLYGGTVSGNTAGRVFYVAAGCSLNVYGGSLEQSGSNWLFTRANSSTSKVTLSGGKYGKDIPTTSLTGFVTDGHVLVEIEDETYGWVVVPELISGATVENGDTVDLKVSVDVSHLTDALNTYNVVMKKQGATDAATSEVTGSLD
ncbi:MAG: hypothetical protein IJP02_04895, partial [Oscillospiraceae bacterium]|nr:hypothetical protein [Oscillospiraceae bacterium]